MASWDINFGFSSSAQSLDASTREIKQTGDGFARLMVNEFALSTTRQRTFEARRSLQTGVRAAILTEVSRMATLIGRFALPNKYTGPYGSIPLNAPSESNDLNAPGYSIRAGMSETARRFEFRSKFDREGTGIKWSKRTPSYMKWKKKHGYPQKWWELTGELQDRLKSPDLYEESFGPIHVLFLPKQNTQKAVAGFSKAVDPQTGQSRPSGINVTGSGLNGRNSVEYEVGRLEISVFNRITSKMLPGLSDKKWNPYKAEPSGNIPGLAALLPDDGPGGIRNKLIGKQAERRYALEPFVSFFMMRAIPNAVWRRTESLINQPTR